MKLRGSFKKYNPFWSDELEELKRNAIRLHHEVSKLKKRNAPLDAALKRQHDAKIEYANAIGKASTSDFRNFCKPKKMYGH